MVSQEIFEVLRANESWETIVMQLETDVGSELPLTFFDVTHPGLAVVKVDMF